MHEYTLTSQAVLDGYQEKFEGVTLEEQTDLAIISIAVPNGNAKALAKALQDAYGATIPKAGETIQSKDGLTRFLGMANDQIFAIFDHEGPDATQIVARKLKDAAYYTLQSDNWVALRLSGLKSREVLERICLIDLDPSVFPEGKVARTVMEHLAVILLLDGEDSFILIAASSSAGSFLHAVKTSVRNVI